MKKWWIKAIYLCWAALAGAQSVDTLPTYTATATPLVSARRLGVGQPLGLLDPLDRQLLQPENLGGLLGRRTGIYLKNYGPGRLATLSLHGGSAAQTAIRWAGFDLRSATLGQTDLSLIPVFFIDSAALTARGNGAQYGEGAVTGLVDLVATPVTPAGSTLRLLQAVGRYGNYQSGVQLGHKRGAVSGRAKLFRSSGQNAYPYRDFRGQARRLDHARSQLWAGQLEGQWRGEQGELSAYAWWQAAEREIPPTRVEAMSVAEQFDDHGRYALHGRRQWGSWQLEAASAYFAETLRYRDSLRRIDSDGRTQSYQQRLRLRQAGRRYTAYLQAEYMLRRAELTAVSGLLREAWPAISGGMRQRWRQLAAEADLRWTRSPAGRHYWLPNLALQGLASPLRWQLAAARVYRFPTFNDRFWPAGGNPDLQAEQGWELSLHAERSFGGLELTLDAYSRWLDNYILWRPIDGLFRVGNAGHIRSRGLDLRARWQATAGAWPAIDLLAAYVRATDTRAQQLIYTPAGRLLAGIDQRLGNWHWRYQFDWRSRVFTLADKDSYLPARGIHHVEVLRQWGSRTSIALQIHNLFNTEYEQVANYPLPGLTWTLSGRYNFSL